MDCETVSACVTCVKIIILLFPGQLALFSICNIWALNTPLLNLIVNLIQLQTRREQSHKRTAAALAPLSLAVSIHGDPLCLSHIIKLVHKGTDDDDRLCAF